MAAEWRALLLLRDRILELDPLAPDARRLQTQIGVELECLPACGRIPRATPVACGADVRASLIDQDECRAKRVLLVRLQQPNDLREELRELQRENADLARVLTGFLHLGLRNHCGD